MRCRHTEQLVVWRWQGRPINSFVRPNSVGILLPAEKLIHRSTGEVIYNEDESTTSTTLLSGKGARVYIRNYDICRMHDLANRAYSFSQAILPAALCSNGCMQGACAGDVDFWYVFSPNGCVKRSDP